MVDFSSLILASENQRAVVCLLGYIPFHFRFKKNSHYFPSGFPVLVIPFSAKISKSFYQLRLASIKKLNRLLRLNSELCTADLFSFKVVMFFRLRLISFTGGVPLLLLPSSLRQASKFAYEIFRTASSMVTP